MLRRYWNNCMFWAPERSSEEEPRKTVQMQARSFAPGERGLKLAATGVIAVSLGLLILAGGIWANYSLFAVRFPGGNDFLSRWVGAHAWFTQGVDPYSEQVSVEGQRMIYGREANDQGEDKAHFAYPLYSMLLFAPTAFFPFPMARAMWMAILEVCLMGLAAAGFRLAGWKPPAWMLGLTMLYSLAWYHGLRTIVNCQTAGVVALLMVLALLAIETRRDAWAGIFLALSTSKPQMAFVLIPLVLLWALTVRRWRLIGWTVGVMAVLVGASLALIPDWPFKMAAQIQSYTTYTDIGSPVNIITTRYLPGLGAVGEALIFGGLVAYLLWGWWRASGRGGRAFQWAAALTIVVTNLIAFRTATTNYVVMLPAALLVFRMWQERWGRRGLLAALGAMLVYFVGEWWLFLATLQNNIEQPPTYLPLPFLLLLGLWLARGDALREAG